MCLKNHNLIIVFDGVCNLCNKAVDFVIKRDKKELFRFCPLQSKAGQQLTLHYNIPAETDSVILIFNNKIFTESEAALKIARLLHKKLDIDPDFILGWSSYKYLQNIFVRFSGSDLGEIWIELYAGSL